MRASAALVALLCAAALAGCGGDSPGGDSTATPTGTTSAGHKQGGDSPQKPARQPKSGQGGGGGGPGTAPAPPPPIHHEDSGGGATQFKHKGSDNSIQESGAEASESQLEEAATALHGYLDAGARQDWAAACDYLAKTIYRQVAATSRLKDKSCPAVLGGFFSAVPRRNFVEAAKADVGSFRVEGDHGFVLYKGAEGLDYSMPMIREGGGWMVAAIAGSALL